MDTFIRLTAALMLREVRARGSAVTYTALLIGSIVAALAGFDEWPWFALLISAVMAVLQTTAFIAADIRSGWLTPLRWSGYSGAGYVRAAIAARGLQSGLVYAFSIVPYYAFTLLQHPARAVSGFLTIPQCMLSLGALCAGVALVVLVVRDASWAVAVASVLLVGPTIFVIAFTATHHALPPARVQTLVSLHVPPFALRPDIHVYWKVGLYIALAAAGAARLGDLRIGRQS